MHVVVIFSQANGHVNKWYRNYWIHLTTQLKLTTEDEAFRGRVSLYEDSKEVESCESLTEKTSNLRQAVGGYSEQFSSKIKYVKLGETED